MSSTNPTSLKRFAIVFVLVFVVAACAGSGPAGGDAESSGTSDTVTSQPTSDDTDDASTVEVGADTGVDATDFEWEESEVVDISLDGTSISVQSQSVAIDGSTATITAGGTYRLAGTLEDGQVIVDSLDDHPVRLVFDGLSVTSSTGPAVGVASAEKVVVILADGSENTLTDAATYSNAFVESNLDAALVSKADMAIGGTGSLTVSGNYNDAIASSDGLVIVSGDVVVNAVDDGIRGKDQLIIEDGTFSVIAGGDGLKSDNEEDEGAGYISILGGDFRIEAAGDAVAAATEVDIVDGTFDLETNGAGDVDSAKGIKAGVDLRIVDGTFAFDVVDDALHSNGTITIDGGDITIATGDDGVHADAALTINGGSIVVTESYEGLESAVITINGGDIEIASSDDGINISGGNDGSGQETGPGAFGDGGPRGRGDQFAASEDEWLYINGGTVVVYASGDGIDVNGYWEMTGGTVVIHGPTENMNGALDVNGTFEISGGFLIAVGSAGMAESPEISSDQAFLSVQLNGSASYLVQIAGPAGDVLLTFAPAKVYQSLVFSSPDLVSGESYEFYIGGQGSGAEIGGVYESSSESGTAIGSATAT